MRRPSPYRRFTLVAILITSAVAISLAVLTRIHWLIGYAIGINIATFTLYAYDKAAASRGGLMRVPERVLHAAALLGGTPAAAVARGFLRHKSSKRSFTTWFVVICVAQLLLAGVLVYAYAHGDLRF